MTKQDLQKELKEKVKEGVKPSDIKRLKRSKSTGDISVSPELAALQTENVELKRKVRELENKEIFVDSPEENTEELKVQINELEKELDQANESRLKALQDFDKQQEKIKQLEKELESTAEYGSDQITKLEKINRELKRERSSLVEQLKLTKQDLENFHKINELRLGKKEVVDGWNKYGTIIPLLVLMALIILLSSKNKHD